MRLYSEYTALYQHPRCSTYIKTVLNTPPLLPSACALSHSWVAAGTHLEPADLQRPNNHHHRHRHYSHRRHRCYRRRHYGGGSGGCGRPPRQQSGRAARKSKRQQFTATKHEVEFQADRNNGSSLQNDFRGSLGLHVSSGPCCLPSPLIGLKSTKNVEKS